MPVLLIVGAACAAFLFHKPLAHMVRSWGAEEYSHGYMIPLVAAFLLWKQAPLLRTLDWTAFWPAVGVLLLALFGGLLGELSSLFVVGQYAFVLALWALGLAAVGRAGFWQARAAFVYLLFMIPLPDFLYNNLSSFLQLVSTEIGVAVIRVLGVSVFVEGNVIDLGTYQLQVVEACSGLRYLFPLASFGFLIAALYRGPFWHRAVLFLSTLPITVLMNSLRIGVIGVTVEHFGIGAAEGFLHFFEGWIVFIACLGTLVGVAALLNRLSGRDRPHLSARFDLDFPGIEQMRSVPVGARATRPVLLTALVMLALMVPVSLQVGAREELIPQRETFASFPLLRGEWIGRDGYIEADVLQALKLTDHLIVDYRRAGDPAPVNFYAAYYASQRAGASIHSPRSCMPGGGWRITELSKTSLANDLGYEMAPVNRAVIELGSRRQLVYYWFAQRGRVISNEYLAKWYLFQDSLTMGRSDGALIRLVTPIGTAGGVEAADARLRSFLKTFHPELTRFVPGAQAPAQTLAQNEDRGEAA